MKTIWKYQLPLGGMARLSMPSSSEVLSVANQNDNLVLWALVYPQAPLVERRFFVALTGGQMPVDVNASTHIGTVLFEGGGFVAHVFEVRP